MTDEAQLYQNRFNFTGPLVITHEKHENNSQAWPGVNTTSDISKELRLFFPSITNDVVDRLLELYPETDYSSPGLRFADMKQSFDMTAHDYALTRALKNQTWNGMVDLGKATHGTDQSYYCMSFFIVRYVHANGKQGTARTASQVTGPPAALVVARLLIRMSQYVTI